MFSSPSQTYQYIDETTEILAEQAFKDNKEYDLTVTKNEFL